jgi:urease accessory protein UreH
MNGLNVSLDATLDEESNDVRERKQFQKMTCLIITYQIHPPTVKRKRSDIAEGQGSDDDAMHRVEDHGERKLAGRIAAEDTSKKRRLPESISRAYCDDVVALPESLTKMSLT